MKFIYTILLTLISIAGMGQNIQKIKGKITSAEDGTAMPGITVRLKGENIHTVTGENGAFEISPSKVPVTLLISYIGYDSVALSLKSPLADPLVIRLKKSKATELQEVSISTGYQTISKERMTGSVVQVDNELLNRTVSTDLMSRLKDVVPGVFSMGGTAIKIRGESTIFANNTPLVILDNFPYEGDPNNINPNDIDNITVLKDAAAASIWGAKAGNGVIVITTKKGRYNKPAQISVNSSVNIGEKPRLFDLSKLSVSDYIDKERKLFTEGFYQSTELSASKAALSPVVELMIARREGEIDETALEKQISILKTQDVRNDFNKYLNRNSVNQQHSLNIVGGGENQRYFISGGYDRNLSNLVGNQYSRASISAGNTYSMLRKRMEVNMAVYYVQGDNQQNNPGNGSIRMSGAAPLYPYARLADDNGAALAIIKEYRPAFISSAEEQGLLDWKYRPLEEIGIADEHIKSTDLRLNTSLKYRLIEGFNAEVLYQYSKGFNIYRNHQRQESYFTRNQINRLTQVKPNNVFVRPIPLGGILDQSNGEMNAHNVRGQLNYNRRWNLVHELTAMAGAEVSSRHDLSRSSRLYGYDDEYASSKLVDYISNAFPLYYNPVSTNGISSGDGLNDLTNNFLSYYLNASYSYRNYTLYGSARKDQSNLFGVKTNQKGIPLWSAGLSWNINEESFYHSNLVPRLKFRASYGYNGNVDKTVTAFTTAIIKGVNSVNQQPYSEITNPPNPELRWERIKIINLGLDFSFKDDIASGSIEYYAKQGLSLIGNTPFPPSSGITSFKGNTANTKGQGIDLTLNNRITSGTIKWNTNFFMSILKDEVSKYLVVGTGANYVQGTGTIAPQVGKPLTALYSYPWAGLDPQTGDPQGYLDGQISKEYLKIMQAATPENIIYNGNKLPRVYGALRNNIGYKDFTLSASISFRLDYYFRNASIIYSNDQGLNSAHGDIYQRWQKPGDEQYTQVPSMPLATNNNRDNFYMYSSALILKGDHIRLQDLRLAYSINSNQKVGLPFQRMQIYAYMNNIGLIWKANTKGIDPDYQNSKPLKTLALGLTANF